MAAIVAGGAAAACTAGVASYLFKYPRKACVKGGRYSVGSCCSRFPGSPAYQIFYPAEASACTGPASSVFFRPELTKKIATDYLKGWVPSGALRFLTCRGPYHENVPVETGHGKFPIIIFSHGLFGTLDMYKTLCGELAASGFIVIAIEHEDASALYSVDEAGNSISYKGAPAGFKYEDRNAVIEFRRTYISKRAEEIKKVLQAVRETATALSDAKLVESILKQVNLEMTLLAGHSFGGAACARIVGRKEIDNLKGCLLLDMWAWPVPKDIEETGFGSCPAMFINSQAFAEGKEIRITQRISKKSASALGPFWIEGCAHQSFSDTPCLLPRWIGGKIKMTGTSDPDAVHQAVLDSARTFFQHCCESSDVHDKGALQSLKETILTNSLMRELEDAEVSTKTNAKL